MIYLIDKRLRETAAKLVVVVLALGILGFGQYAFAAAKQAGAQFVSDQPTVLITGSNRGIGMAFARYYAAEGWNVIATCRKPAAADELQALAQQHPHLVIEQLDVTDHARIQQLADEYSAVPIDVLINNAAVLGALDEQQYGGLDFDLFEWVMAVNVYGPMKMGEAFTEHVAASDQKKIVTLTSGLGSLKLMGNMKGMNYYRISKAGVNMAMRGLRADLKERDIIVALVAPGMVGTQLLADSGYKGRSLSTDESVAGMAPIIAGLTIEDKGTPTNVTGKAIPW